MSNGHKHNLSVAWIRMWGAVGATAAGRLLPARPAVILANELVEFECARFAAALYALRTTENI